MPYSDSTRNHANSSLQRSESWRTTNSLVELLIISGPCFVFGALLSQWAFDIPLGPIGLNFFHVAILFCFFVFMLDSKIIESFKSLLQNTIYTQIAIIFYLIAIGVSVTWSENPKAGAIIFVKYVVIYVLSLVVASIIRSRRESFAFVVSYLAVPISLIIFFVYANVVFIQMGKNLPAELLSAIQAKSMVSITHNIINPLFLQENLIEDSSGFKKPTVIKNEVASVFFILFCLAKLTPQLKRKTLTVFLLNAVRVLTIAGLIMGIGILGSRTIILMVVLCLGIDSILTVSRSITGLLKTVGTLIILGGGVVLAISSEGGDGIISGIQGLSTNRFDEIGKDGRWGHYEYVLSGIQNNVVLGNGLGTRVSDGMNVHNIILGGAFEAGLIGMLSATLMYFLFWTDLVKSLLKRCRISRPFSNPELWAFLAVFLPLIHCLFSGAGGRFTNTEWLCVALFWGYHACSAQDYEGSSLNPIS